MMGNGFGFGIPGFGMILFWGLLILVVIWLVRGFTGPRSSNETPDKSARRILDERFARGEIDEEEYEHRRKLLK